MVHFTLQAIGINDGTGTTAEAFNFNITADGNWHTGSPVFNIRHTTATDAITFRYSTTFGPEFTGDIDYLYNPSGPVTFPATLGPTTYSFDIDTATPGSSDEVFTGQITNMALPIGSDADTALGAIRTELLNTYGSQGVTIGMPEAGVIQGTRQIVY